MIHKIKALYDQGNGLTIRAIARQLGISRNTVRKYLRMDETAIAEQQESRVRHRQLDDHRDYIISLLGQFPDLSAVKVLRKLKQKHPALAVSDRTARRYIRLGLSPLVRGKLRIGIHLGDLVGSIPACAGETKGLGKNRLPQFCNRIDCDKP